MKKILMMGLWINLLATSVWSADKKDCVPYKVSNEFLNATALMVMGEEKVCTDKENKLEISKEKMAIALKDTLSWKNEKGMDIGQFTQGGGKDFIKVLLMRNDKDIFGATLMIYIDGEMETMERIAAVAPRFFMAFRDDGAKVYKDLMTEVMTQKMNGSKDDYNASVTDEKYIYALTIMGAGAIHISVRAYISNEKMKACQTKITNSKT